METLNHCYGHFTHETEGLRPIQFKHPHWWKRGSQSKFTSHYTRWTNGVCECKMDVNPTWIPTWHQMDHVSWSLGLFEKTASWRPWHSDRLTQNRETMALRTLTWIEIHWKSIWLRIRSHMTSHYTWGSVRPYQWLGRLLDIITGWDPSVCKSNR